ncbi:uncharacterized protein EV420DRAFT_1485587 [Desarmillaria tabescens]|uniref:Uncharacterized protein n=1 Tax=Armillaria tabescens TaxID=1929756 RepID=A0AA39MQ01_ARMTA|nr:uncharacterized protein EV420DRAFT_1485587 [Desarmillaria tabescens]KAK0441515.1 hypothetical protein EV420DRAFT_1485587 [Desarmillaria tabescens]
MSFTRYSATLSNLTSIMGNETLRTEYQDAITFCNNNPSQLAGYGDIQRLLAETMVDSESRPDASFIVNQETREEMVFQMQGIVLEVALPPIVRRVSVNHLQQSVTIVGLEGDRQFVKALAAISCMLDLLSQLEMNHVRASPQTRTGNGVQVTFRNRLLTPSHAANEDDVVALLAVVDPHNLLSKELQPNKFSFTKDSNVSLEKYSWTADGHLSFVQRLDSIALMSTVGAPLVQAMEMASRNHEVQHPLPRKRRQDVMKIV